ncbi:hypothetical protein J2X07_002113 [Fictibacillus barbaricus]|uniref:Uncharacterized protein n=1 Tax=Fictibacillus barbaricus TaxID=182136 RepID=A0ABU1U0Y2_9BACL|nr:hypothetical protein [Fictibacillus barbaricus]
MSINVNSGVYYKTREIMVILREIIPHFREIKVKIREIISLPIQIQADRALEYSF